MARKIADNKVEKEEKYPWLRLLELEVQPSERTQPHKGRGRPPNPFPRKAVHVTLTDDELAALDGLAGVLTERFGRMNRGHLIAFLVFYLRSRLGEGLEASLPPEVHSLTDLARYLDGEKEK